MLYRAKIKIDNSPRYQALIAKWTADVLAEGFIAFPKKFVRTLSTLFPEDASIKRLSILLSLVDAIMPGKPQSISREYLAFLSGLNESEVDSIVEDLKAAEMINFTRRGGMIDFDLTPLTQRITSLTAS